MSENLKKQLEQTKRQLRSQKLRADELEKQIEDYHASNFTIPRQRVKKFRTKGSYIRVAFGDTHGCSLDQAAWSAFLADMEHLKPKVIVHGGDILDCDGWLAAHHTTNYVAQTDYSYAEEVIAGNIMFDQLQASCPKAVYHVLEGNHDLRVETLALTVTMKKRADAQLLIDCIAPYKLLHIKERGFNWYSRGECHEGSVQGGTLKLDKCYFTHPQRASKHHASKMAESFGKNVVFFHTHRRDYFPASNVTGDEWAAWNPGCMCVKRKYWHHTENFKHNQGYHLQLVKPDGDFLGFNVPIINGKSYLSGLIT